MTPSARHQLEALIAEMREFAKNENRQARDDENDGHSIYSAGHSGAAGSALHFADRLSALVRAFPLGEWQPIETAPKDRSWFLGWNSDEGVFIWRDGPGLITGEDPAPTHWMPLPIPPVLVEPAARAGADQLKELFYRLERAIRHAYTGSAEHGAFLRNGGGEYVPSPFLMLEQLHVALRACFPPVAENVEPQRADWQEKLATAQENIASPVVEPAAPPEGPQQAMRECLEWIEAKTYLFLAECSQAEEIIRRVKAALSASRTEPAVAPPPVVDQRRLSVVNRDVLIRRAQARPCSHGWTANPCYACLADEGAEWMRRADERAAASSASGTEPEGEKTC